MENRATTSFSYCSNMASLPVWPYCANVRRITCQADLNSFPLGELEETTRTPPYYVDEDYPAGPGIIESLSPNEATDVAQNHPLWRMISTFGATHS